IKGAFTALGITVHEHLEQTQIDTLFDRYLDMQGSEEDYQKRYDDFVRGFVFDLVHKGKLDRNGLAERIEVMKPLLGSFGKEITVALIDTHLDAHGFIS